jgi:hypothetical protein
VKIYLDDVRDPPLDWHLARSVADVHVLAKVNTWDRIAAISLDHDLGDGQPTGQDLARWIEEAFGAKRPPFQFCEPPHLIVHSWNPVGRQNMERTIASIERLRRR